jgi:hypothetical protein
MQRIGYLNHHFGKGSRHVRNLFEQVAILLIHFFQQSLLFRHPAATQLSYLLYEVLLNNGFLGTFIFAYVEIDYLIYREFVLGDQQPIDVIGFGRRSITAAACIIQIVFQGSSYQVREQLTSAIADQWIGGKGTQTNCKHAGQCNACLFRYEI